jgi:hypothetical protein
VASNSDFANSTQPAKKSNIVKLRCDLRKRRKEDTVAFTFSFLPGSQRIGANPWKLQESNGGFFAADSINGEKANAL